MFLLDVKVAIEFFGGEQMVFLIDCQALRGIAFKYVDLGCCQRSYLIFDMYLLLGPFPDEVDCKRLDCVPELIDIIDLWLLGFNVWWRMS